MNEIINNTQYALSNKELSTQMNRIREALNKAIKSANDIGKALKVINDKKLWEDDYKSFEECANQFGIKKAQAYNLIKGYEISSKYKEVLVDFNNTQCVEVAKLDKVEGEKGVKKALEEGIIKQDMTTKELRESIDKYLNPEKYVEEDEEAEEAEEVEAEEVEEAEEVDEWHDWDSILEVMEKDGQIQVFQSLAMTDKDLEAIEKIIKKYI